MSGCPVGRYGRRLRMREKLENAAVETLYDDREGSMGIQFNVDLMGAPIRLTLTPRSLEKLRRDGESCVAPLKKRSPPSWKTKQV